MRHMDYGVQINKLMYTRLLKGEDITLFSPSDVPGLYDAFFADQEEFERLYTKYEKDDSIRKQRVKAVELFSLMMQEVRLPVVSIFRTLTTAIPIAR
ncbi:ribonucleoside-diphosphate reductase [Escherichia coli]|nr:ribonucleoside-diphosphate reductase [Escherichia coli]